MMTGTQTRETTRTRAADGRAVTAAGAGSRSRRPRLRLWTWLNAQALLNGPVGVASAEDDRGRMAARRPN
jgi:hypothetical protein